ncbi:MAG: hypothetical protein KAS39_00735, partial [Actinomycetia bacterium]|nr:hypothetical protein [Actinomycetes bacterium]
MGIEILKKIFKKISSQKKVFAVLSAFTIIISVFVYLAFSMVRTTITIDGSMKDWMPVLSDGDNVFIDGQGGPPDDLDTPGNTDSDLSRFAITWDNDYLYVYFRRVASGNPDRYFWTYIDLGNDGTLTVGVDMVFMVKVSSTAFKSGGLYYLEPAQPPYPSYNEYPVTGDGEDEILGYDDKNPIDERIEQQATSSTIRCAVETLDNNENIELEARIGWSMLGVEPGTAMMFHGAMSQGSNIPNSIQDNVGPYSSQFAQVLLEPDNVGSSPDNTTVVYTHTLTNQGNSTDTYSFLAYSNNNWTVILKDYALNTTTSVTLAREESTTIYAYITIPAGQPYDKKDITTIRATSDFNVDVRDEATDITHIGGIVVMPDNSGSITTGTSIFYSHKVVNHSSTTLTIELSTRSRLDWPTTILDESGSTTITTVSVGPNSSTNFKVKITAPSTATVG